VPSDSLSAAQARRVAIAAQGLADPRPTGRVTARQLRKVVDRISVLQIDSVNVLSRSHYLPVFARLGPYPRDVLDRLSWGPKAELFEYWAHAASLLPMRLQPLLRWRMAGASSAVDAYRARWEAGLERKSPGLLDKVRAMVAEQGPIAAGAVGTKRPNLPGSMWNWHLGKEALELLFYRGEVSAAGRPNFERLYDLPERVFPADILAAPTPAPADAHRELIRLAARAHGVATESDLADYFRMYAAQARAAIGDLVESGELLPVTVEGWGRPGFLWHEARLPRRVGARALLSPFDSLVWERDRNERIFGFHYRIEIYTPAAKRVFGYYVLPFLLGDQLVARVDLKADRKAGVLRVQAAHSEGVAPPAAVVPELAEELALMAGWLGLAGVAVVDRGDLAAALAVEVAALG
jgi:uncharacterized protein YcaQ